MGTLKIISRRIKELILQTIGQFIKGQNLDDIKIILPSILTNGTSGLD